MHNESYPKLPLPADREWAGESPGLAAAVGWPLGLDGESLAYTVSIRDTAPAAAGTERNR
jgi:hypothetical protein